MVEGYKVISKTNDNWIFLPAGGGADGNYTFYDGTYGYYWTSSMYKSTGINAYHLLFYSGWKETRIEYKHYKCCIRPVKK